jgi:hypothetical protein
MVMPQMLECNLNQFLVLIGPQGVTRLGLYLMAVLAAFTATRRSKRLVGAVAKHT